MRHSTAAVVVLFVGVGALGACGGDDDATVVPGTVVVDDSGSGATYDLPAAFAVGQTATLTGEFTSSVSITGPNVDDYSITVSLEYRSEVVALTDDGGAIVESEFLSAAVEASDEGVETGAFEDLAGVRYRETYAADGSITATKLVDEDSLSAAQRTAAEDLIGQAATSTITFPTEPVGVGATWTSDSTLHSQGVDIVVIDHYELVDVEDGIYTITVEYTTPIDESVGGDDASGSISARGTIRGDVENPLAVTAQLHQVVDMSVEGQGTLEMAVDVATRAEGIDPVDDPAATTDAPSGSTADSTTGSTVVT